MPRVPTPLARGVAAQLAFPAGVGGRIALPLLDWINRPLMDGAVDVLAPAAGTRIADIGCGGGRGVRRLLEATTPSGHVYAIDPSATAVNRIRRRHHHDVASGHLTVERAPMHQLPLADGALDAAVTTNTLYYIEDLPPSLVEVRRVLTSGGRLVVGVGDPGFMERLPIAAHGPILRPVAAIIEAVTAAGFVIDDHRRLDDTDDAFHVISAHAR